MKERKRKGLLDKLVDAGLVLAVASVAFMVLLVVVEVIARRFFKVSTQVSVEFSGYLLVSMTFLSLAYVARSDGFLRVETFYERATGRTKQVIDVAMSAMALLYSAVLLHYVAKYVLRTYHLGTLSVFHSQTPLWIPQVPMAVGLAILFLQQVRQLILRTRLLFEAVPPAGEEERR